MKLYFDGTVQNSFPGWLFQYQTDNQALQAYREQKGQWLITWSSNYLAELPVDSTAVVMPSLSSEKSTLTTGWVWALSDPQPDRRELSTRLAEHLVQAEFLAKWTPLSAALPVRPTTMDKWDSSSIQSLLNEIIITAKLIPGNDTLNALGPILQEAVGLVLKEKATRFGHLKGLSTVSHLLQLPDFDGLSMLNQIFTTLKTQKTLIAQILLVVVFVGTLAWGTTLATPPVEETQPVGNVTITPLLQTTPLAVTTPVEFTPNQNETDGIIFTGVLLVLIIVVGTLGVINQRD